MTPRSPITFLSSSSNCSTSFLGVPIFFYLLDFMFVAPGLVPTLLQVPDLMLQLPHLISLAKEVSDHLISICLDLRQIRQIISRRNHLMLDFLLVKVKTWILVAIIKRGKMLKKKSKPFIPRLSVAPLHPIDPRSFQNTLVHCGAKSWSTSVSRQDLRHWKKSRRRQFSIQLSYSLKDWMMIRDF